jgi:hypothetical protein
MRTGTLSDQPEGGAPKLGATFKTDIVVIGAGQTGLSSAITSRSAACRLSEVSSLSTVRRGREVHGNFAGPCSRSAPSIASTIFRACAAVSTATDSGAVILRMQLPSAKSLRGRIAGDIWAFPRPGSVDDAARGILSSIRFDHEPVPAIAHEFHVDGTRDRQLESFLV